MDTPTYNAEGREVWKPQPGQFHQGGLRYVQSYGGIVSALQDIQVAKGMDTRAYPNNFAGIIAAIEDIEQFLVEGNLPDVGAPPPGWEIIVNPDGSIDGGWQEIPRDGTLWFDTRQGRMFIAIDGEFVQTNGADGISHVGPNPPTNPPVVGQHWLNTTNNLFYVYLGEGTWQAITSEGDISLTTGTLPLERQNVLPDPAYTPTVLPPVPTGSDMQVQADLNEWVTEGLFNIEQAINESSVTISDSPPTENVVPGTLWYDSEALELSIYYQDGNSAQWVPTSVGFGFEEALSPFQEALDAEIAARESAVSALQTLVSQMDVVDDARVDALEAVINDLSSTVSAIQIPNITHLATKAQTALIENRVSVIENTEVDLTPYATTTDLNDAQQSLLADISSRNYLQLSDVTPLIPDVSAKVEQSDIDESIANITTGYLPRTGGTLDGSFIINKSDVSLPAFDVSNNWYNSQKLFKLQSYSPTNATATFGATDSWWEYAWNFSGEEDFAWVYADTNKVFSVSKDGPACSQLYIGDFRTNDENGRKLANTMEVGSELRNYKQTFADIKQAVLTSTDFNSLKTALIQALSNV